MTSYRPHLIASFEQESGLFNYFEPFLIPEKAFPQLTDAYCWRGKVKRRIGYEFLGRLQRGYTSQGITQTTTAGATTTITDLLNDASIAVRAASPNPQSNAQIAPGSVTIVVNTYTFTDLNSDGVLIETTGPAGYVTAITGITKANPAVVTVVGHNFTTADTVYITGVGGMTEINNAYYSITNTTVNTITLNVDSTLFDAYTAGGTVRRATSSINYSTAAITLIFVPVVLVGQTITVTFNYFPMLPVMGFHTREDPTSYIQTLMAFDQTYAYKFNGSTFQEFIPGTIWHGTDNNFFWTIDYFVKSAKEITWTSNFNASATPDPLRYTDGTSWTNFLPALDGVVNYLLQALILIPYKGYLIALNTYEGTDNMTFLSGTNFPQRARWNGQYTDPTAASTGVITNITQANPAVVTTSGAFSVGQFVFITGVVGMTQVNNKVFQVTAIGAGTITLNVDSTGFGAYVSGGVVSPGNWISSPGGLGGFRDAPTNESITSAVIIKDTLLVKFETSSWKIIYTGIPNDPFRWELINTELGADSTFSVVPFDRGAFTVGNYGITTDDTVNVARIDQKIPDFVFNINDGLTERTRTQGIRDFSNQLVLWTFVSNRSPKFPDTMLIYNYVNSSYAIFKDSFTALGTYFFQNDFQWKQVTVPWEAYNVPWGVGQSQYPSIVGGNQQGYVETLLQGDSSNDNFLAITAITPSSSAAVQIVVPNHNLKDGRFINIKGILGSGSPNPTALNGGPYFVEVIDDNTLALYTWDTTTNDTDPIILASGGTYLGGGQVEPINGFDIQTKVFVPYYEEGMQLRVPFVDFFLQSTADGQCICNMYVDENNSTAVNDPLSPNNSGLMESNVLFTSPEGNATVRPNYDFLLNQNKIWHRFFLGNICQNFQLQLTLSNAQLSSNDLNASDFVMHAMTLYTSPNARLVT